MYTDMNQIMAHVILDLPLNLLAYRHTTHGQEDTYLLLPEVLMT